MVFCVRLPLGAVLRVRLTILSALVKDWMTVEWLNFTQNNTKKKVFQQMAPLSFLFRFLSRGFSWPLRPVTLRDFFARYLRSGAGPRVHRSADVSISPGPQNWPRWPLEILPGRIMWTTKSWLVYWVLSCSFCCVTVGVSEHRIFFSNSAILRGEFYDLPWNWYILW